MGRWGHGGRLLFVPTVPSVSSVPSFSLGLERETALTLAGAQAREESDGAQEREDLAHRRQLGKDGFAFLTRHQQPLSHNGGQHSREGGVAAPPEVPSRWLLALL